MKKNQIVNRECVAWLKEQKEPFADLIFADPPFNIGYKYDVYEDRKAYDEYHAWTVEWMTACEQVLKPHGTFWIAIGDDYAAEVRLIANRLGLHLRNWVVWHYTFGQNTQSKFARSHTHLFYFTKDPRRFTFNDTAVRIPSARQTDYADKRANPNGRLPDDVWTEFPRVCGTFKEREGWHPCQMPETVLARIIRACTDGSDMVFDPFAGSGTTLAVAKKLSRNYVGCELSGSYAKGIERRLRKVQSLTKVQGERHGVWPSEHNRELKALYLETGVPSDRMADDAELLTDFARELNRRLEPTGAAVDGYQPNEVREQLIRLRKQGKLGKLRPRRFCPPPAGAADVPGEISDDPPKQRTRRTRSRVAAGKRLP